MAVLTVVCTRQELLARYPYCLLRFLAIGPNSCALRGHGVCEGLQR